MLHFLDVGGASHIDEGQTLFWIGFNAHLRQHAPNKLPNLNPEITLGGIQTNVKLSS